MGCNERRDISQAPVGEPNMIKHEKKRLLEANCGRVTDHGEEG